jgi:catechol 1,2-dioxygenase
LLPAGYRVPPDTPTSEMLDLLGRHGWRPAHIHFMVSASGFEQLTTQVNLPDDPYLNDDTAFATRDELIVSIVRHDDPADIRAHGFNAPFVTSSFDFRLARPA